MWSDGVLLSVGLLLLLAGGEGLVRGASGLARQLGVSTLVIGLTVVAFGTSAPELAVNLDASLRGNTAVAFGNVVGSNIANVGLILGCAALVRPLAVEGSLIAREIPMMLLASTAALVLGLDRIVGEREAFDRGDGLMLLLLFAIFLYYTIGDTIQARRRDPLLVQARDVAPAEGAGTRLRSLGLIVVGLGGLVFGAELTVSSAVGIAESLHVPREVIGLTLVAVGTSLPELVTCVVAARRGQVDLAVGNVVGSNLFNLLFVLATAATVRPLRVPAGGALDLVVMLLFGAVLLGVSVTQGRRITRLEGGLLLGAYVCFTAGRSVFS